MKFIEKLTKNETVIGPFSKTSDPAMIESMGYAGFDFIIIDLEHGPNSILNAQHLVRAAEIAGAFPIIRVAENNASQIGSALDIGARGIQVPQIDTAHEARQAIEYAKFAPMGKRGVCRFVRAAQYSHTNRFDYFKQANENLLIMQLEGQKALDNIDEIISVTGLDIVFIGPYDLSQSLGFAGEINHPVVINEMKRIIEKCQAKGILTGVFTDQIADARKWIDLGVKYIAYSVDVGMMHDTSKQLIQEITQHYD